MSSFACTYELCHKFSSSKLYTPSRTNGWNIFRLFTANSGSWKWRYPEDGADNIASSDNESKPVSEFISIRLRILSKSESIFFSIGSQSLDSLRFYLKIINNIETWSIIKILFKYKSKLVQIVHETTPLHSWQLFLRNWETLCSAFMQQFF